MASCCRLPLAALLVTVCSGWLNAQYQTRIFLSGGWFQPVTSQKTVYVSHHLMGATRPTWQVSPLDIQVFYHRHIPVHLAVRYQQTTQWQKPFIEYFDQQEPALHHNYLFDQTGALSTLTILMGSGYEFRSRRNFLQINALCGESLIQASSAGVELKEIGTHKLTTYNYRKSTDPQQFRFTSEFGLRGGCELVRHLGLWAGISAQCLKRNEYFRIDKRNQHSGLSSFSTVEYSNIEWALLFNAGLTYRIPATRTHTK